MSDTLRQLKKGVTTLIVLDALEHAPLYGYGLRQEAYKRTRGTFNFSEGALYPLLHSLERKRWVKATRREVDRPGASLLYDHRRRPPVPHPTPS